MYTRTHVAEYTKVHAFMYTYMCKMSGSPNLNSFRDRGQVAVQLVSCGVLLPGLVQDCTQHSCVIAI